MRFRPCIDIHNGQVRQIVGGSLADSGDRAEVNFSSRRGADYYARLYKKDGLTGGHVILLIPPSSSYYNETRRQAFLALSSYPGGLQIGGGVTADNAKEYLDAGASHVIVTSYVFRDGELKMESLKRLADAVGKEHIVIDLSCRKRGEDYYVVTDRWQKFTDMKLSREALGSIARYCDEFLVHGVDVEGKSAGIDSGLVGILKSFDEAPVTYAGGIGSYGDIEKLKEASDGKLDFTVGSALDLFGGRLSYDKVKNIV